MFKKLALFMSLLALLGLAACSRPGKEAPKPEELDPKEPLTICFDLDASFDPRHFDFDSGQAKYTGARLRQEAVDGFLEELAAVGGPRNVQVEFLEDLGSDREGQLTRLRAELMAGEGPDLFVLRQNGASDLFLFPEKKMEDGLFLPLDRYLEAPKFMDPGGMVQPIWDAGKSADGRQMLLPMTYDISVVAMRAEDVTLDPEKNYTLSDMLSGGTPWLTGALAHKIDEIDNTFGWNVISLAFGQLADYKKEELRFTQEDLGEILEGLLDFNQRANRGELGDLPRGVGVENPVNLPSAIQEKSWRGDDLTLAPLYGREGGVTARVIHFAGVNANAGNPAGAFWAADFLLGEDYLQSSDFGMYLWCKTLPVCQNLLQEDKPLFYQRDKKNPEVNSTWSLNEDEWRAFTALRERITDAEYPTVLDGTISQAYFDMFYSAEDEPARKKVITETYSKLKMLLGES